LRVDKRYLTAVALLAVLAVVFGLAGTVAPPLAEETAPSEELESSDSGSTTHFMYPPSYDSGWVDISTKHGQQFTLRHGLNTTEVIVDISGKQSLDPMGGALEWARKYGGAGGDRAYSVVQTSDGGYALAGGTSSFGASEDFWLVKTDSVGIMEWNKTYGGEGNDRAYSVVQTSDGGYALAGCTYSLGVGGDFWLVKTDSVGNMKWSKNYGGPENEEAYSMVQTVEGGYALAGCNSSAVANYDFCLVKVDSAGTMEWSRNYGTTGEEVANSVVQTNDGGYALAGYTDFYSAFKAMYIVKTNSGGTQQWWTALSGTGDIYAYSVIQTVDGGYALAGSANIAGNTDFLLAKADSGGTIDWSKNYAGAGDDVAFSMVQTVDGGYALAGRTGSFGFGGDFWLVKTNPVGTMEWSRNCGGAGDYSAVSLVQTSDGGYALAGSTFSPSVYSDLWFVKVRSEMNREHKKYFGGTNLIPGWSRIYGGAGSDEGYAMVQTSDGGYALAGYTDSFGVGGDFWLIKTDPTGAVQWERTYGGAGEQKAYCLVQTSDNGYALAGYNASAGPKDFFLVKTNSWGIMEWSKNYGGGACIEEAHSLVQTGDGGYAVAGFNYSYVGYYFCLVKADSAGNMQWNKNYGVDGSVVQTAYSLVQTVDGGYALAGTNSSGNDDFCLVKTDSAGNLEWSRNYGGTDGDYAYSVVQTSDGGYALAGDTNSYGVRGFDFLLVKTTPDGTLQWNKTYGEAGYEFADCVIQTSDGGYALAGDTDSFGAWVDFWLIKTDPAGTLQWSRTYGGPDIDFEACVIQTVDSGYALAGRTYSYGAGGADFWLVKTDIEMGLALTDVAKYAVTLYRGKTDLYWNYIRVRIWTIKEPTWQYGDINQDGIVDVKDLYILSRNYGKTFSLLSLSGIMTVAGIHTIRTRKQQPKKTDKNPSPTEP